MHNKVLGLGESNFFLQTEVMIKEGLCFSVQHTQLL